MLSEAPRTHIVKPMAVSGSGSGGCWPTEDQVLLLRAAVLDGDDASDGWSRWRARNDPKDTDRGSVRLLPLVYRNVPSEALDATDLTTLKSSYQAAWYRNQLRLKGVADALRVLHDAGIRTLVLKGVALVVAHYGDAGVRPMDDADVLVPWDEAQRALAALTGAGWAREPNRAPRLNTAHAEHLGHAVAGNLDLHRSALAQAARDEPFWSASTEIEILGVRTRTLAATDQLLHVAAHGARWGLLPPVHWMADAVTVARVELDWDRFVAEARRRRMTLTLTAALEHLVDAVGFEVPTDALARLRSTPKAPLERLVHRLAAEPRGGGTLAPLIFDQYIRLSRLDPTLRLGDFLRDSFRVRTRGGLVRRVVRKAGETAAIQSALIVAPRRVRRCAICGRQFVRLPASSAPLCATCAPATR